MNFEHLLGTLPRRSCFNNLANFIHNKVNKSLNIIWFFLNKHVIIFFIIPDPLSIIPHPRNGLASYKTPHLPQSSVLDPTAVRNRITWLGMMQTLLQNFLSVSLVTIEICNSKFLRGWKQNSLKFNWVFISGKLNIQISK